MDTQQYSISTANIYDLLFLKWKNNHSVFARELFIEIQTQIVSILHKQKVKSIHKWEDDSGGLFDYVFNRYPRYYKEAQSPEHFPIPEYIVLHNKAGAIEPNILSGKEEYYKQNLQALTNTYTVLNLEDDTYFINKKDNQYNFFFAVQLSLTDIMEANVFLRFHLANSFESNVQEYMEFLHAISIKHKKYLGEDFILIIDKFCLELSTPTQKNNKLTNNVTEDEVTLRRKVLAMKYLFSELDINNDKIAVAEFIKLITGKELNQKTKDGNIYKLLKKPFPISDKSLINDLSYIRTYFEKLGLGSIVATINKEIISKEKI